MNAVVQAALEAPEVVQGVPVIVHPDGHNVTSCWTAGAMRQPEVLNPAFASRQTGVPNPPAMVPADMSFASEPCTPVNAEDPFSEKLLLAASVVNIPELGLAAPIGAGAAHV